MSSYRESIEWAKEKMGVWGGLAKEKSQIELDKTKQLASFDRLTFENRSFTGDVVNKEGDLIFHFFPTTNDRFNVKTQIDGEVIWVFGNDFASNMADSFLAVFKYADRLFSDFVPELNSWVVRAAGFGGNPLFETLVEKLLVELKRKIGDD